MGPGTALAIFKNTSLAFEGQAGSTLPKMAPQAKWKRGSEVEVGWWIRAQCVCLIVDLRIPQQAGF